MAGNPEEEGYRARGLQATGEQARECAFILRALGSHGGVGKVPHAARLTKDPRGQD